MVLFPAGALGLPFGPVTFDDGMGGPEIPEGWTFVDGEHDGFMWRAMADKGGLDLGTGPFAIVDSDLAGLALMDEQLISPTIDASGVDGLILAFDQFFFLNSYENADVDVSTDGGFIWNTVASFTSSRGSWESPNRQVIDISDYASPTLKIRFYYHEAGNDEYWAVDNVEVFSGPTCPVVIDEVYYDPTSTDDGQEYITLYNKKSYAIDLEGWEIEWGGTDFTYNSLTLGAGVTISAHDTLVIGEDEMRCPADVVVDFNPGLQNGGTVSDGVRLVRPDASPCDTVIYDAPNTNGLPCDGQAPCPDDWCAEDVRPGLSLQRNQDHADSNNCADDFVPAAPLCPCAVADAVIECGYEGDGSTVGGYDYLNDYSCTNNDLSGPEYVYQVTTTVQAEISVRIHNMTEDLDILILREAEGMHCVDECGGHDDDWVSILYAASSPGIYYIVVDGREGAESGYHISVQCDCLDADQDGYADETCQGQDCDDADPAVNPDAVENCYNGIDDDCNGFWDGEDPACDTPCRQEDALIECGEVVQGSTTGGISFLDGYPFAYCDESGPELVFLLSLQEKSDLTATLSDLTADLDLILLEESVDGACPDEYAGFGDETFTEYNRNPGDHYIVVDGHRGDYGDFTLTLECVPECPDADGDYEEDQACGGDDCDDTNPDISPRIAEDCMNLIDDDCDGLVDGDDPQCVSDCRIEEDLIACGEVVYGTTVGGVDILDVYSCATTWYEWGPELAFLFTLEWEADISAWISGMQADLDIFVLSDSIDGACPENCLENDNDTVDLYGLPPGDYYIVVDGYKGASDFFALGLDCW